VDGPVGADVWDWGAAAWLELGAPEEVVDGGVTRVGVAAVELESDDGAVGATATAAVDAALVEGAVCEVELGVDPIVAVDPVVPLGAFAAARVLVVTISPLAGTSDRNDDALGWRMFATACLASPPGCAVRKATACGGGITIPIDAASCSIR
jgi:hypothetical protein